jgi:hypothetical protein
MLMGRVSSKATRTTRMLLIIVIRIAGPSLIVLEYGEYNGGSCNSEEIGLIKLAWNPGRDPDGAGYKL